MPELTPQGGVVQRADDFLLFWVKLELVLALAASLENFAVWVRRREEVEAGEEKRGSSPCEDSSNYTV